MVWFGMVWNRVVRWLGNLIYREVAGGKGVQHFQAAADTGCKKHLLLRTDSSEAERLMRARWQIDFDRRRDADISGIGHCGTAWYFRQHTIGSSILSL